MSIEEDMLIREFLNNTLSEKERNEVLLRIETDTDFKEKVNFEKQLFLNLNEDEWSISKAKELPEVKEYEELLKSNTTQELKNTLRNVNAAYQSTQKKKTGSWLMYSGIAMILMLIGITVFSLYPTKISPDELYASYLNISELPSLVDRGGTDKKTLIKVQKLFEDNAYSQALDILKKESGTIDKNKATILLYTGISQMELNQFASAEETFDTLIHSGLIDAPKGTWYKALLFIKQHKLTEAKVLLSQIVISSANYKSKEALELLEVLNSL